jgi:hypothetical protein
MEVKVELIMGRPRVRCYLWDICPDCPASRAALSRSPMFSPNGREFAGRDCHECQGILVRPIVDFAERLKRRNKLSVVNFCERSGCGASVFRGKQQRCRLCEMVALEGGYLLHQTPESKGNFQ